MGNEMPKVSAGLTPAVEAESRVGARDGRTLIDCTGKEEAAAGGGTGEWSPAAGAAGRARA